MWEFLGRWLVVGGVTALAMALGGGGVGVGSVHVQPWQGVWEWGLFGLWVGFVNALLRTMVLEIWGRWGRAERDGVLWLLAGSCLILNAVLFCTFHSWGRPGAGPGVPELAAIILLVSALSWGASAFFHGRDGRWHWLTSHGIHGK